MGSRFVFYELQTGVFLRSKAGLEEDRIEVCFVGVLRQALRMLFVRIAIYGVVGWLGARFEGLPWGFMRSQVGSEARLKLFSG